MCIHLCTLAQKIGAEGQGQRKAPGALQEMGKPGQGYWYRSIQGLIKNGCLLNGSPHLQVVNSFSFVPPKCVLCLSKVTYRAVQI